jgi:hypothetical protein
MALVELRNPTEFGDRPGRRDEHIHDKTRLTPPALHENAPLTGACGSTGTAT